MMNINFWLGYVSEWLGAVAVVMIAAISPMLKKIRRIDFRFPRREATFALSLFVLVYFLAFQYYSSDFFLFLKKFAGIFSGGVIAERMLLAVISLVLFLIALVLRGQPFKSIGWGRANTRAGVIVGLLLVILTIFLRGKFITVLNGITADEASLLLVILALCVAEETIFRGYIQLRLMSFLGNTWGWLATAGLFILWQLPGRLWLYPLSEIWVDLVIAAVQGLLFGWIMRKTGHVTSTILFRAAATWIQFL
ncbi:MAG: CPBP family intramembrane metalloprotease [Anaerolineaceae bacterium]|nr:CPBP family intramembrane metalloprotease [Anaerolineaceae bacterium]